MLKCFDTTDHKITLFQDGVHYIELNWFKSYLSQRKQTVKAVHNILSKYSNLKVEAGVPQVSVFGPFECLMCINDAKMFAFKRSEGSCFADTIYC